MPKVHFCEICHKGFSRVHDLKRHSRTLHGAASLSKANTSASQMVSKTANVLQHPFTCMVSGPTGSGKTLWVERLLMASKLTISPAPERVVWCYSQWQPIYDRLVQKVPGVEFHQGIPAQIATTSFFNINQRNLVVLDDLMTESGSDKSISNLFTRGSHHMNLSVIYIVQNLFNQGKMSRNISLNSQYLVLFKSPRDKQQILVLARQLYPRETDIFMDTYERAIKRPHGYLFVDLKPSTADDQRLKSNILPGESRIQVSDNSDYRQGVMKNLAETVETFLQGQRYLQTPQLNEVLKLDKQMSELLQKSGIPDDVKSKLYSQLFQRHQQLSKTIAGHSTPSVNSYSTTPATPTTEPTLENHEEQIGDQTILSSPTASEPRPSFESGIGSMGFSASPADVFGKIRRNIEERKKRLSTSGTTPSRYLSYMNSEEERRRKLQMPTAPDAKQQTRNILEGTELAPQGPLTKAWISMTDDQNTTNQKMREAQKRQRRPTQLFTPSDF